MKSACGTIVVVAVATASVAATAGVAVVAVVTVIEAVDVVVDVARFVSTKNDNIRFMSCCCA